MRILSLYFGHDSSACLLEDGRAVAVIEKERTTRIRHDSGRMDLESLLDQYGWRAEDIDCVAINPLIREGGSDSCDGWDLTGSSYRSRPDYLQRGLRCAPEARFSRHDIRLLGRTYPCVSVDHHLGHIATGYYTSPFEAATVLSADGGGDARTVAAARGEGHRIVEIEYGWGNTHPAGELNIGSLWGSIGQYYLGYGRLEGAGKLMGLAPYGRARPELVQAMWEAAHSAPRSPLPEALMANKVLDATDPTAQDLAASVQAFTTDAYLRAAERLARVFGDDYLVSTGGCGMNCVANTALHTSGLFRDTWVPAQPSDCGLALGQALFTWHHVMDQTRQPRAWSPYLGADVGGADDPSIASAAVEHLLQGRTVGVCVGQAENGPRALGHRSILADPRIPEIRARINNSVKHREWYRPLAPMVLEEDFARYFAPDVPSRYMSYVTQVTSDRLPGITHVDGSTRPQVISREDQGMPRLLLEEWKRRSGIGVLLNTSFNSQEPVVDTVEQAYATWQRTALDVLVTPHGVHAREEARAFAP
ncbi:carbamoyltransferase C-terminal domain-containing protein [Catellatospora chokoriensis]|uniref:Carbamoyltransferase n=1 Tax=Catellatospora chokoriensis TaxID=310353 RepID=A0A8J3K1E3_9ACTN|nr:carbamoyltransferase C-terminal domain-containing protein [Catellatospora chokoriensis]GIF87664.1 hypothetical protein Cch02nite_11080 [Catellatospora chokoriensis]